MDQLPKIVQRHLQGNLKADVHPDPDLLAAFSEKSLRDRERSQVLQHLADCADCREILSLAMPSIEDAPFPRPETSSWLSWPVLRWGALVACVVVVSAAVTLRYGGRRSAERSPVEQAVAERAAAPASTVASNIPQQNREEQEIRVAPRLPAQAGQDPGAAANLTKQGEQGLAAGKVAIMADAVAPRELDQKKAAEEKTSDRLAGTFTTNSAYQPASPAASAPSPAAGKPREEFQTVEPLDKIRNNAVQSPGTTSETTTVEGAVASKAEMSASAKLKAKDESSQNEPQKEARIASTRAVGGASSGNVTVNPLSAAVAQNGSNDYAKRARADHNPLRWTLSADGSLQRSSDLGKTWQTIPVGSNPVFRALAANDSDIWAGGAAGALYHSSDAGQNWVQVTVVAGGKPLAADIVGVDFSDAEHGKVTTSIRETWTTNDAGRTWQRY
jgi:Photosynthesis system II assembly factor YCF48